jgi:hypothetical protein
MDLRLAGKGALVTGGAGGVGRGKSLAFHSCRTCGCTTHWEGQRDSRMAVNCRMADPAAIAALRIRRFDGADSWAFLD